MIGMKMGTDVIWIVMHRVFVIISSSFKCWMRTKLSGYNYFQQIPEKYAENITELKSLLIECSQPYNKLWQRKKAPHLGYNIDFNFELQYMVTEPNMNIK